MLYPQNNAYRRAYRLDGYWDFKKDQNDEGEKLGWANGLDGARTIAVPASWNEQANELYHYHGKAWYQTSFSLSESDMKERIALRFSSVEYGAKVFVNGSFAFESSAPYLPFEHDITDLVHTGDNLLAVKVNGEPLEGEPVRICDFYGFAGIDRPVFVCVLPKVRISDVTVRAGADGKASISVTAVGDGDGVTVTARIGNASCTLSRSGGCYTGELQLERYERWSLERPVLYTVDITLSDNGRTADCYRLKTGFRDIAVSGRKILLNGEPVYLKGFDKHEDFCILGKGLSHALNVRDFDLMKWTGANSFRTSHYPYSEELLDLADREGFLVIDEAPFAGMSGTQFNDPKTCGKAVEYMKRLIDRDKNHPCVISYSIGNECDTADAASKKFFLPVIEAARKADHRPLTYVAWTKPDEDNIYQYVDIIGLNRYYGWYPYENWHGSAAPGDLDTALKQMDECLRDFERLYSAPLIVTEFGADTVAGFHSTFMLQFSEEFQAEFLRSYIRLIKRHPSVTGMHVWNFADFSTEQSPGRVMGNKKGVFTRERAPKQAAFILRNEWLGESGSGLFCRGGGSAFKIPGE